ncbi:RNA demethylase ALKBH10B isoform X2 [Hevea brasiliensis]|uniref:RNA demethylase ALKBH10B isoform X2 n=1 Tax=Hevea brasiliensis TaxID=3981 RepID=UPI0025F72FC7|nr:RNA demethylase ALKBH10B isoform X2 [Hevea brasiliensis]
MPMAAGIASPTDRAPPVGPTMVPVQTPPMMVADAFAKDAILAWFRGEFAAANAVIDALCSHLAQLSGGPGSEYEEVFAAIHRRRLNWIPVLQMQKYHSIADVAAELKRVAERKLNEKNGESENKSEVVLKELCLVEEKKVGEKATENIEYGVDEGGDGGEIVEEEDSPDSDITDTGETFILFNKQMKGNKRELIQLGVPIFGHITEEATSNNQTSNIEPIPALLLGVINHLVQWQLIPEYKKPNGCIIHFFDEDEYSQPFQKPPHLEQPVSTLLLSESTMAFGRALVSDNDGNYRGPLMLSLKEGSLLVMRGNSSDMARHVMCPSPNKRVSITFFKVRPDASQGQSPPTNPVAGAMTLWQPNMPGPYAMPNGALGGYEAVDTMTKWGVLRTPVVMLAPVPPMVLSPKRISGGGTGVFLPWTVGSRKHAKHLPPRAQKGRLLKLSSIETDSTESASETGVSVEGK